MDLLFRIKALEVATKNIFQALSSSSTQGVRALIKTSNSLDELGQQWVERYNEQCLQEIEKIKKGEYSEYLPPGNQLWIKSSTKDETTGQQTLIMYQGKELQEILIEKGIENCKQAYDAKISKALAEVQEIKNIYGVDI